MQSSPFVAWELECSLSSSSPGSPYGSDTPIAIENGNGSAFDEIIMHVATIFLSSYGHKNIAALDSSSTSKTRIRPLKVSITMLLKKISL